MLLFSLFTEFSCYLAQLLLDFADDAYKHFFRNLHTECQLVQTLNDAQYYSLGIIAKHENTIVIAFRGTASFTDVLADLPIVMIPYPDHRGHLRPKVHFRFY